MENNSIDVCALTVDLREALFIRLLDEATFIKDFPRSKCSFKTCLFVCKSSPVITFVCVRAVDVTLKLSNLNDEEFVPSIILL